MFKSSTPPAAARGPISAYHELLFLIGPLNTLDTVQVRLCEHRSQVKNYVT